MVGKWLKETSLLRDLISSHSYFGSVRPTPYPPPPKSLDPLGEVLKYDR